MKPYSTHAVPPPMTQDGIEAINAWTGSKNPINISIIAAPIVTLTEAHLLKPIVPTLSPYEH